MAIPKVRFEIKAAVPDPLVVTFQVPRGDCSDARVLALAAQEAIFQKRSLVGRDLKGADFSDLDVSGGDFSGTDLTGAKFVGSKADRCKFDNAVLHDIDVTRMKAKQTSFIKAYGEKMTFNDAVFVECDLAGMTIDESSLEGTALTRCRLEHAKLSRTKVESGIILTECDLDGMNVDSCSINSLTLQGQVVGARSDAMRSRWTDVTLTNGTLTGIDFENANFTNVRLGDMSVKNCGFLAAEFDKLTSTDSNFTAIDARRSYWKDTALEGGKWMDVNLTGGSLRGFAAKDVAIDMTKFAETTGWLEFKGCTISRSFYVNAGLESLTLESTTFSDTYFEGANIDVVTSDALSNPDFAGATIEDRLEAGIPAKP